MSSEIDLSLLRPSSAKNSVDRDGGLPDGPANAAARSLRILLLEPYFPAEAVWGSAKTEQGFLPPMGTISVYGWLKHRGFDVTFLDTQFGDLDPEQIGNILVDGGFDVVGLPTFTPTADYVFDTARLVRRCLPKAAIILGNVHASQLPEFTLTQCPAADFVIRHEAEVTIEMLLEALAGGLSDFSAIAGLVWRRPDGAIVVNPPRPFIRNLDDLPPGFYSDLKLDRYVPHPTQYIRLPNYPLMTQRGCPYSCSYCEAGSILGKKMRMHSPERVLEELRILKHEKGARGVYFQDSTFTINKKWVMRLMELMVKDGLDLLWTCNTRADRIDPEMLDAMYAAGCRQLAMGLESGNQSSLDLIRKGCTVEQQTQGVQWAMSARMRCLTSYILCLPNETPEMVRNTIDYAKSLRTHTAMFYLPVPFPGSDFFLACQQSGGIRRTVRWSDFIAIDFDNPVYVNPNFGADGMRHWYRQAYLDYYRSPGVWWSNLTAIRGIEDARRLFRGGRGLAMLVGKDLRGLLRQMYRGFHGQGAPVE
ncbi:B12-binding domain-containing radical SAM protein [Magnetospirillum sp. UT-4]|uniref:B12-binding domain-containing radical SAM protein n=1 Tax=Magnetospirillum sp. UT-4 TaxID=2681467 RepID=UPI0013843C79|nr:radical SAM protein [Magnetospirillum sp. UT-4]CAA7612103.1 putative enzyme [Magnetospirillum sp. UT-4]